MTVSMKRAGRISAGNSAIAVWVLVEVCAARLPAGCVSKSATTLLPVDIVALASSSTSLDSPQ
jgi:hypothetical protein